MSFFNVVGQQDGEKCAKDCKGEIKAYRDELGKLAGAKLGNFKKPRMFQESEQWRVGFFDGFLAEAEKIRSGGC